MFTQRRGWLECTGCNKIKEYWITQQYRDYCSHLKVWRYFKLYVLKLFGNDIFYNKLSIQNGWGGGEPLTFFFITYINQFIGPFCINSYLNNDVYLNLLKIRYIQTLNYTILTTYNTDETAILNRIEARSIRTPLIYALRSIFKCTVSLSVVARNRQLSLPQYFFNTVIHNTSFMRSFKITEISVVS